jgi:hypothetical protein
VVEFVDNWGDEAALYKKVAAAVVWRRFAPSPAMARGDELTIAIEDEPVPVGVVEGELARTPCSVTQGRLGVEYIFVPVLIVERVHIVDDKAQHECIHMLPEIIRIMPLHVKADAIAFYPSVSGSVRIILKPQAES